MGEKGGADGTRRGLRRVQFPVAVEHSLLPLQLSNGPVPGAAARGYFREIQTKKR